MKTFLGFLFLVLTIALNPGCSSLYPPRTDNRDFAVDTYPLNQAIMDQAALRAQKFWAKRAAQYGSEPSLLAIEAYMVDSGVLDYSFIAKINRSETTASYDKRGARDGTQSVTVVVLFDLKTGRLYDKTGYIFVDTPSIGTAIHVGKLVARFIGWG
jgi:hypothetical protein